MIQSALGVKAKEIEVVDRQTNEKFMEIVYGDDAMKLAYGTWMGKQLTSLFLTGRFFSSIFGAYNDSGASKHRIEQFVKRLKIDVNECEKDLSEYQSFNDFFARKLKPEARPIVQEKNMVASPGDGRLLAFQSISEDTVAYVKWAPIKLFDLFDGRQELVDRFKNGTCLVLRLCPADYHRFHFPIAGMAKRTYVVEGQLHSVSPYALEEKIPVYCLNRRTLCELESEAFGSALLMEIGAMFVGSIVQTYRPETEVQKGDEKGYFKFGGSTSVLFFEEGAVDMDSDILKNTENGLETLVKMGEAIASKKS